MRSREKCNGGLAGGTNLTSRQSRAAKQLLIGTPALEMVDDQIYTLGLETVAFSVAPPIKIKVSITFIC